MSECKGMRQVLVWHDEASRLETWGTLDPTTACMCTECVLGNDHRDDEGRSGAQPKWVDLFGMDPDFTGGQDINEYLDESRGDA